MAYLEELLPEFRKGAKIRRKEWDNDTYVRLTKDGIIANNDEKLQVLYTDEILADSWEIYKEPDWNYIVKNKCLCWFWDDDCDMPVICAGLIEIASGRFSGFRSENGSCWRYCRPVRRDEVSFYEEKKDE